MNVQEYEVSGVPVEVWNMTPRPPEKTIAPWYSAQKLKVSALCDSRKVSWTGPVVAPSTDWRLSRIAARLASNTVWGAVMAVIAETVLAAMALEDVDDPLICNFSRSVLVMTLARSTPT